MVEASIYAYLNSKTSITDITTNIVIGHIAEDATEYPILTFQPISTVHDHTRAGAAGVATTRMQFDCWSDSKLESIQLAEALRQVMHGYIGTMGTQHIAFCKLENEITLDEKPTAGENWLYRRSVDYMITYSESVPTF